MLLLRSYYKVPGRRIGLLASGEFLTACLAFQLSFSSKAESAPKIRHKTYDNKYYDILYAILVVKLIKIRFHD